MVGNSSFHRVRLLAHNRTRESMKVHPILFLALNAAVASYLTARTTNKVFSFFGWMLAVRTNTMYMYTAHIVVTINCVQKFKKGCRNRIISIQTSPRIHWLTDRSNLWPGYFPYGCRIHTSPRILWVTGHGKNVDCLTSLYLAA